MNEKEKRQFKEMNYLNSKENLEQFHRLTPMTMQTKTSTNSGSLKVTRIEVVFETNTN